MRKMNFLWHMIFVFILAGCFAAPCHAQQDVTASQPPATLTEPDSSAPVSPQSLEEQDADNTIHIAEAAVCRDVIDREPVGAGDVFSREIKKLFCFSRVIGGQAGTMIRHDWYWSGKKIASVPLRIGAPDWRTYSTKRIIPELAGEWRVDILGPDDTVLEKIYFMVD